MNDEIKRLIIRILTNKRTELFSEAAELWKESEEIEIVINELNKKTSQLKREDKGKVKVKK